MLDNDNQINAFAVLSASGVVTPAPVVVCEGVQAVATQLATSVRALPLAGATYPASVSDDAAKLAGYATVIDGVADAAAAFVAAVKPFSTPSELVQLKTGWECHVKGNRLSPAPPFALVAAMGDQTTPDALNELLQGVSLSALTAAMNAVNAKVGAAAAPADASAASTVVAQALTDDEIAALKDATAVLDALLSPLPACATALTGIADQVNTFTSTARKALSDAIAIALTTSLSTDPVMGPAVSTIMPAAVMAALKQE